MLRQSLAVFLLQAIVHPFFQTFLKCINDRSIINLTSLKKFEKINKNYKGSTRNRTPINSKKIPPPFFFF